MNNSKEIIIPINIFDLVKNNIIKRSQIFLKVIRNRYIRNCTERYYNIYGDEIEVTYLCPECMYDAVIGFSKSGLEEMNLAARKAGKYGRLKVDGAE